jgi:hypothetical protein
MLQESKSLSICPGTCDVHSTWIFQSLWLHTQPLCYGVINLTLLSLICKYFHRTNRCSSVNKYCSSAERSILFFKYACLQFIRLYRIWKFEGRIALALTGNGMGILCFGSIYIWFFIYISGDCSLYVNT